jgi:hypothetical protein
VDEEVLGLEHAPFEVLVLHLVLAEVLLGIDLRCAEKQYAESQKTHRFHLNPAPDR